MNTSSKFNSAYNTLSDVRNLLNDPTLGAIAQEELGALLKSARKAQTAQPTATKASTKQKAKRSQPKPPEAATEKKGRGRPAKVPDLDKQVLAFLGQQTAPVAALQVAKQLGHAPHLVSRVIKALVASGQVTKTAMGVSLGRPVEQTETPKAAPRRRRKAEVAQAIITLPKK